jgi:hypothetical protein
VAVIEVRDAITAPSTPEIGDGETVDAFQLLWFTLRLDVGDPSVQYRHALEACVRSIRRADAQTRNSDLAQACGPGRGRSVPFVTAAPRTTAEAASIAQAAAL